jgi:hypothetical protein
MIMLNDAAQAEPGSPQVRDVAELIAEQLLPVDDDLAPEPVDES